MMNDSPIPRAVARTARIRPDLPRAARTLDAIAAAVSQGRAEIDPGTAQLLATFFEQLTADVADLRGEADRNLRITTTSISHAIRRGLR